MAGLLVDVHECLKSPGLDVSMVTGSYQYFHYGCDGQDDRVIILLMVTFVHQIQILSSLNLFLFCCLGTH